MTQALDRLVDKPVQREAGNSDLSTEKPKSRSYPVLPLSNKTCTPQAYGLRKPMKSNTKMNLSTDTGLLYYYY
jgi:hypothetical protein